MEELDVTSFMGVVALHLIFLKIPTMPKTKLYNCGYN